MQIREVLVVYSIIQNACTWTEDIIFNLTQFHHNILKICQLYVAHVPYDL